MSVITNLHGLPEAIVRAVQWSDRPEPQPKTISVTTLLRPPQLRALEAIHSNEIESDVAEGLWRLLGSAVHSVLERASDDGNLSASYEERFFFPVGQWRLSGQVDLIEDGILSDYKVTSVYSFLLGEKESWTQQLNLYRWLAVMNGHRIEKLQIVAILRDHQTSKVSPDEPDYPKVPLIVQPVEMWSLEKTESFIRERLAAHEKSLIDPHAVPCTPEDRWERLGKFAVMKRGQKRAMRLLDTHAEAEKYIHSFPPLANMNAFTIETRPTIQKRCESFCPCLKWCPQALALGVVKK